LLFVVLGAVLYGVWVFAAPEDVETGRVEGAALRAMETQQFELLGRPLTEDEIAEIREAYIDDEVLLREALDRGLHFSDSRTRRRLTLIMRGALTETVVDPSVAQLQAYFRDNIDRFTTSESASIEQVFFPWGEEIGEDELGRTLGELRGGADPEFFGTTSFTSRRQLPRQTRADLVRAFGADFADWVEQLPAGEWRGPVESVQGIHLVRVTERHPPEVATFDNVERYLRQEWLMTKTRELQQEGIDEIRARYRIEIVGE
jgi:hypothetical protein